MVVFRSRDSAWESRSPVRYLTGDCPVCLLYTSLSAIQSNINNINEIHDNYMKKISYGKYDGSAEDIVAEYRAALQSAGFETVLEELQKQVDAVYK